MPYIKTKLVMLKIIIGKKIETTIDNPSVEPNTKKKLFI